MQTSRAFAHFLLCLGKESTFRNRVQEYNPEREVLPTTCIGCVSVGAATGAGAAAQKNTKKSRSRFEDATTFSNCQQSETSPGGQIRLSSLPGLMLVKVALQQRQQGTNQHRPGVRDVNDEGTHMAGSELTWSPLSHTGCY